MKGFVTKCGGLKLLVIVALVMATCGTVVAAEANEEADKKEVLTIILTFVILILRQRC